LIFRGDKTISVDNYVFVEPIIIEKKWTGKEEQQHVGIIKYSNSILDSNGVKSGDKIAFKTDSEYEFIINEQRLYRMRTSSILAKLN
jgi:co-chaperonin GroES (HSP10)